MTVCRHRRSTATSADAMRSPLSLEPECDGLLACGRRGLRKAGAGSGDCRLHSDLHLVIPIITRLAQSLIRNRDKKLESWVKDSGFLGGAGKGEPTIVTPKQCGFLASARGCGSRLTCPQTRLDLDRQWSVFIFLLCRIGGQRSGWKNSKSKMKPLLRLHDLFIHDIHFSSARTDPPGEVKFTVPSFFMHLCPITLHVVRTRGLYCTNISSCLNAVTCLTPICRICLEIVMYRHYLPPRASCLWRNRISTNSDWI